MKRLNNKWPLCWNKKKMYDPEETAVSQETSVSWVSYNLEQCGLQISSVCITWLLVTSANSQAHPRPIESGTPEWSSAICIWPRGQVILKLTNVWEQIFLKSNNKRSFESSNLVSIFSLSGQKTNLDYILPIAQPNIVSLLKGNWTKKKKYSLNKNTIL